MITCAINAHYKIDHIILTLEYNELSLQICYILISVFGMQLANYRIGGGGGGGGWAALLVLRADTKHVFTATCETICGVFVQVCLLYTSL